jgi:predicted HicB family RNase H-like nuclease
MTRPKKKVPRIGRPPKNPAEVASERLDEVRFTPNQKRRIKAQAEAEGKPVSQWVRERLGVV